MDSNSLKHPTSSITWWTNDEEKTFFKAFEYNYELSLEIYPYSRRDGFIYFMIAIECFFKYAYALARYDAFNELNSVSSSMNFLEYQKVNVDQRKSANFGHDVGLILSTLRKRYKNLSCREVQDFMTTLPPEKTTTFNSLSAISWMAFRYRDGNDSAVETICEQYISDLEEKFNEIWLTHFGGLV